MLYELQVRVDCYVPVWLCVRRCKVVSLALQVPYRALLDVAVVVGQGYCKPMPYSLDLCDLFNDCIEQIQVLERHRRITFLTDDLLPVCTIPFRLAWCNGQPDIELWHRCTSAKTDWSSLLTNVFAFAAPSPAVL